MPRKFCILISNPVKKSIKKIPIPWQVRVMQAISVLENDPFYGEKLSGKLSGKRKIRVWPYRVIYSLDLRKRIITVVEVGHRQGIYR
jgi:addiction module RelE/StbE family toxin